MRTCFALLCVFLLTSCVAAPISQHDRYSEIILNGAFHKNSSCCMGGHAVILIDYEHSTFIFCHSHGEAFKTEDFIAGPVGKNDMVIPDKAVLLEPKHEELLIRRLKESDVEKKDLLISAIKRFSRARKSANKELKATDKSAP